MKRRFQLIVVLVSLCVFAAGLLTSTKRNVIAENKPVIDPAKDPGLALTNPDKFNWALLVEISKKAPANLQGTVTVGGKAITTNNAIWETWASDLLTFPAQPDPSNPPVFPKQSAKSKKLTAISQQLPKGVIPNRPITGGVKEGGGEEVLRNEAAFNYIIQNNLWYVEGLKCAFNRGNDSGGQPKGQRPNGRNINFPVDAIEVKAIWIPITEAQKPVFHWNYDDKGNLFGMNALHIMSKTIPNWTWATWEWSGNPGRCDWLGCHDSFGITPANIAPIYNPNGTPPTSNYGTASGQTYPPGTVTPALLKMFADAGYDAEWSAEWQNYRLKGSMIDFTDITGQPILVGNSVTEAGFVQTASCMTCHVNASVDKNGIFNQSVGFTEQGQSRSGAVDPGWFYDTNTWDNTLMNYQTAYYPIDFVWAILKAQPAAKGKKVPACSQ